VKLGELISHRRAELGLSLEKLANRARDHGYELTKATLSAFVNHDLSESPKRRTMEAIAIALDVSYAEVVMAVARSMAGDDAPVIAVTDQEKVRSWLTLTEGRTETEVASLLRVARTVAAALDAAQEQSPAALSPDDGEQPGGDLARRS
jgi:transcriptional regulator with XRE-family HTH domain